MRHKLILMSLLLALLFSLASCDGDEVPFDVTSLNDEEYYEYMDSQL